MIAFGILGFGVVGFLALAGAAIWTWVRWLRPRVPDTAQAVIAEMAITGKQWQVLFEITDQHGSTQRRRGVVGLLPKPWIGKPVKIRYNHADPDIPAVRPADRVAAWIGCAICLLIGLALLVVGIAGFVGL